MYTELSHSISLLYYLRVTEAPTSSNLALFFGFLSCNAFFDNTRRTINKFFASLRPRPVISRTFDNAQLSPAAVNSNVK